MIMCDAAGDAAEVHDRRLVILRGDAQDLWQNGSQGEAKELCQGYDGELAIARTDQFWNRKSG